MFEVLLVLSMFLFMIAGRLIYFTYQVSRLPIQTYSNGIDPHVKHAIDRYNRHLVENLWKKAFNTLA